MWPTLFLSHSAVRGVHLRYGVGSRYGGSSSGGLFIINQVPQSSTVTSNHSYGGLNPGPSTANRHVGPYRTSGGSYQSSGLPQAPKPSPYFSPRGDLARSACSPGIYGFRIVMKFQPSPFLRVDQAVSNIEECPGQLSVFFGRAACGS